MNDNQAQTVIESLEVVRRRLNWMAIGLGIGVATASFISLLLLVLLADYLLNLNAVPRFVLISAGICTMGYVPAAMGDRVHRLPFDAQRYSQQSGKCLPPVSRPLAKRDQLPGRQASRRISNHARARCG